MTVPNDASNGSREGVNKLSSASKPTTNTPKAKVYPTPKFLFTIYTPRVITFNSDSETQQSLMQRQWKDYAFDSNAGGSKKKVKIKISVLLGRMLNHMIREQIIPREAIQFMIGGTFALVHIQVSSSALPVIMQRCEIIGVGNVVGVCYACPLEASVLPPAGPVREIDLQEAAKQFPAPTSMLGDSSAAGTAPDVKTVKTESSTEAPPDEEDYIIGDRDIKLEEEPPVPRSIKMPFLSEQRKKELAQQIVDARNEWLQTSSWVRVEQVAEEVAAGAAFTWDYIAFCFCAATVAAIGLGTDSATTTIASMLISPIMGPVMGFTFGTTIRNKKMILRSLRNETLSILICFVVGLFWGLIASVSNTAEHRDWPSQEMTSRGDPLGLISGFLIALPSGMATALSTLGKNSGGMVGVAISLSLLPPAVNAGMCWIYAGLLNTDITTRNEGDDTDYVITGLISFCLTLVNILCIWIAGVFTFWLKEVAPVTRKNAFWTRDIKNYREQMEEGGPDVDVDTINDGIQAALALRQDAGTDVYDTDFDVDLDKKRVAAARREGLATNKLEDALFVDGNFGLSGRAVVGGATDEVIPDETKLENIKRRQSVAASLIQNANQFGGLGEAGEALFDDTLVKPIVDMPLPSDADGVDHDNVAKKILLEKQD